MRYVHHINTPELLAGVATMSLEIIEDLPDVDVIVTPIGGGSGALGHCLVAKALRPERRGDRRAGGGRAGGVRVVAQPLLEQGADRDGGRGAGDGPGILRRGRRRSSTGSTTCCW